MPLLRAHTQVLVMFRHIHQVTRVSGGSLSAALQVVKASEAYFIFCHTLMCQSYICHTPLRTGRRLWQVREGTPQVSKVIMKPENMHAVSLFAHTLSCSDPKVLRSMQSDTFELQGVSAR